MASQNVVSDAGGGTGNASGIAMDANMLEQIAAIKAERVSPWDYKVLLPNSTSVELALRVFIYGPVPMIGLITNILSIVAIVRGKLRTNWTYVMLLSLCAADLLNCFTFIALYLPAVVMGR